MSNTKVIYDSGSSSCTVKYDGEMVSINQQSEGVTIGEVRLFDDEVEEILKFVNQTK